MMAGARTPPEQSSRARSAHCAAAAVLLACALAAAPAATTAEFQLLELEEVQVISTVPRPIEDYIDFPVYDSVVISPDGTRLAMGWTVGATYQRQVTVNEYPSMRRLGSQLLQAPLGVSDLRWVNASWLLVQPEWPWHGFVRHRQPTGTIMVTDPAGRSPLHINGVAPGDIDPLGAQRREEAVDSGPKQVNTGRTDHPDNGKDPGRAALGPVRLIAARTGTPDQMLFQTLRTDRGGNADGYGAFLLNLADRQQTRVALLPMPGAELITGPAQRISLATGINAQHQRVVFYLPPEARAAGSNWQLLVSSDGAERGLRPVAWAGTGEEYYALDGRNLPTRAVVIWNAADNSQRVLYRNPDVDMESVALDPTGKPWMFSGNGHFPVYWYPDPEHPLARLHRALTRQLPREQVDVTSATDDLSHAVIRVSSGSRPPTYMVLDVANARSTNGMQTYPKLRGTRLAPVEAIEFRARDGVQIHGYLTTPYTPDGRPAKGAPLLVVSHDGPNRDIATYGYRFERQVFASRGYAVLEVNHRGSSGRGRAFERLGDGQWGSAVQDDFADAVRWAIKDGVAAADRICFMGTGYGAFSAMMAAARAPDLFHCVVGVSGIYDLPHMLEEDPAGVPPWLHGALGDDTKALLERSPVGNAAAIKAKILLLSQKNDEHAPQEQSTRMRSALRKADNPPQSETIGQEYSGYFTPQVRAATYTKIIRYLDTQIGKRDR
jgi:dienelactone hydrolase